MPESYGLLVIEGDPDALKERLRDWATRQGRDADRLLFADEHSIHVESALAHLAEILRLRRPDSHVLVPEEWVGEVTAALEADRDKGLKLIGKTTVRTGRFEFSYTAFSKKHADELNELVNQFASKVTLSGDYQPVVKIDPSLEGIEGYTPAHDFEATARGEARGAIEAILAFHKDCDRNSLMKVSPVTLEA